MAASTSYSMVYTSAGQYKASLGTNTSLFCGSSSCAGPGVNQDVKNTSAYAYALMPPISQNSETYVFDPNHQGKTGYHVRIPTITYLDSGLLRTCNASLGYEANL